MTYFFAKSGRNIWKSVLVTLAVCIWLAGFMQIFDCGGGNACRNPWFYIAIFASMAGSRIFRWCCDRHSGSGGKYEIELEIPGAKIHTYAFLDTGNCLQNPYTKKPAIILDYRLLKPYLSKESCKNLELYHETGRFPYMQMNKPENFNFFPLPYHTIGNRFSLMPAMIVHELRFCTEKKIYYDVTAGISREPFFDEQCNVLLHEKFKP